MVNGYVSIDPIVARVIRNTRVQDMSFIADMHDWIAEALAAMQVQYMLVPKYADLTAYFHTAIIPCDSSHIEGVEYQGRRLNYNLQSIHPAGKTATASASGITTLTSIPTEETVGDHKFYSSSFTELNSLDPHPKHSYQVDDGAILTSFEAGEIRVHYRGLKTDKRGLPYVPNIEDVKEALYWYCRSKMVGAGYKDPVYPIEVLDYKYEKHAERGMDRMSLETPDMAESQVATSTRFVPPAGYYESFFSSPSHESPLYE
jgi:hypothetical protein